MRRRDFLPALAAPAALNHGKAIGLGELLPALAGFFLLVDTQRDDAHEERQEQRHDDQPRRVPLGQGQDCECQIHQVCSIGGIAPWLASCGEPALLQSH